jgi:hypothetical protein
MAISPILDLLVIPGMEGSPAAGSMKWAMRVGADRQRNVVVFHHRPATPGGARAMSVSKPILRNWRSGSSQRVRIGLGLKGIDVEYRPIDLLRS